MLTKSAACRIKATTEVTEDGADKGEFEALVSVFGNVDRYGERVVKGAFADTLKAWDAKDGPIPVIWSHEHRDPRAHIGSVVKAEERDAGLWVKAQLDIDADPVESRAAQVWRLLKGRRVTQFSFAYDIVDAASVTEDGEQVFELRKLDLFEVGPTLLGVNPETELLDAKALHGIVAQLKAGRVLSSKNFARLEEAYNAIGEVLSSAKPDEDDGKATTAPGAAAEATAPTLSPAITRLRAELATF